MSEKLTYLDVLSLIQSQCHRCFAAGMDRAEVDPKYMQEIKESLKTLAERRAQPAASKKEPNPP